MRVCLKCGKGFLQDKQKLCEKCRKINRAKQLAECQKKWLEKNKDYFKNYYREKNVQTNNNN